MMPDIAAIEAQVEAIMAAAASTPAVEIVETLPRGDWGTYSNGVIRISAAAPEACWPLVAAHEWSHHIAIEAGLLRDVRGGAPELKAELEKIAEIGEARFEPWAPACSRRID